MIKRIEIDSNEIIPVMDETVEKETGEISIDTINDMANDLFQLAVFTLNDHLKIQLAVSTLNDHLKMATK